MQAARWVLRAHCRRRRTPWQDSALAAPLARPRRPRPAPPLLQPLPAAVGSAAAGGSAARRSRLHSRCHWQQQRGGRPCCLTSFGGLAAAVGAADGAPPRQHTAWQQVQRSDQTAACRRGGGRRRKERRRRRLAACWPCQCRGVECDLLAPRPRPAAPLRPTSLLLLFWDCSTPSSSSEAAVGGSLPPPRPHLLAAACNARQAGPGSQEGAPGQCCAWLSASRAAPTPVPLRWPLQRAPRSFLAAHKAYRAVFRAHRGPQAFQHRHMRARRRVGEVLRGWWAD